MEASTERQRFDWSSRWPPCPTVSSINQYPGSVCTSTPLFLICIYSTSPDLRNKNNITLIRAPSALITFLDRLYWLPRGKAYKQSANRHAPPIVPWNSYPALCDKWSSFATQGCRVRKFISSCQSPETVSFLTIINPTLDKDYFLMPSLRSPVIYYSWVIA